VPRIIQDKVDNAELTIDSIAVTNPSDTEVTISINSVVHSENTIKAWIEPFTADMYLEDKYPHVAFAQVNMPQTHTGESIVNVTQQVAVTPDYIDFNTWVLLNESVRVTVEGDTVVHAKALKAAKVHFKKTITLKGINGFKGLKVQTAKIDLIPDARGDNFHGQVDIPNPSIISLDVGNATFANLLENTKIGTLYIDNLSLVPGINNVSVRANISQAPVLQAIQKPEYCADGILPFELEGEKVEYNGRPLPQYATGLALGRQQAAVDVGSALKVAFGGKSIGCKATK
jgi:hypothetical protein